jgi:hypothetical protein
MKRLLLAALLVGASACGSSNTPSPVAPTPTSMPTPTSAPALLSVIISKSSPLAPRVGQTVTFSLVFNATANDVVQRVVMSFGDGTSITVNTMPNSVSHSFASAGTFSVAVTATDTAGNTVGADTSVVVAAG